jgi:hypothetical protein
MGRRILFTACLALLLLTFTILSVGQSAFTLSPTAPNNYTGNTLTSAAIFAWQEFIALNWPNQVNANGTVSQRGTPSTQPFGTPNVPLVWHTFRGKVEIFPGTGQPNGYNTNSQQSYGFDAAPAYNYAASVSPCSGVTPPSQPAWINLDETTQIGLDSMYAGVLANYKPPYVNSAPQLIRFMAKGNRAQYTYVTQPALNWYAGVPSIVTTATKKYLEKNLADPPPGNTSMVSFPLNTIEVKAAFRPLGPQDVASRFYTTKVRYYEPSGSSGYCYVEDNWALIGLHIIQKTANSPFFVYATFEQADNLTTTAGKAVEDANGKVIVPNNGASTNPALSFKDSNQINASTPVYPTVSTVPAGAPYCPTSVGGQPNMQLFYRELGTASILPAGGPVCQVSRDNPIPPAIAEVNATVHAAIASYTKANGVTSPFVNYKLVNVQAAPINKTTPGMPYKGPDRATYYQSNSVVETDYTLQLFSTAIFFDPKNDYSGPPTDYNTANSQNPEPVFPNTDFNGKAYSMGGCMGCHGNAQVGAGTDFSFITAGGRVNHPDTPAQADLADARKRYLKLFVRK